MTPGRAGRLSRTVNRLRHFVFVRHRRNWAQLIRFGMVGGSGVVVNMLVVILFKKVGPDYHDASFGIPLAGVDVRWYHVMVTVAFLVANCWNFLINRHWTFHSHRHAAWYREYPPFLAVGAIGQIVNLALVTALLHSHSWIELPSSVFDDSSGLRTKLYWAQLIAIAVVLPISFVVNKLWTFSAVRRAEKLGAVPPAADASSTPETGSNGALQRPPSAGRLK